MSGTSPPEPPEPRSPASWHPAHILATWFGAGLSPVAPGTVGSLAALPLAYLLSHHVGIVGLAVAIVAVFLIGVWAAHSYSKRTASHDAGPIVIDEVVGQWLALLLVPADIVLYAIGFALFRLADIIKPWPIGLVDKRVKGGFGVMFDDVLAGILAAIILWNIWMWTSI
jgi:phosphatidylglycerophosphatase A